MTTFIKEYNKPLAPTSVTKIPISAYGGNWRVKLKFTITSSSLTLIRSTIAGYSYMHSFDPNQFSGQQTLTMESLQFVTLPIDHSAFCTITLTSSDYNAVLTDLTISGILLDPPKIYGKCHCDISMLMNKGCQCGGD